MGAASSSSADFINAAAALRAESCPEPGETDEAAYWLRIFPDAPIAALDVFSVIQPEHVRELRAVQPRNLALMIIKVRSHRRIAAGRSRSGAGRRH